MGHPLGLACPSPHGSFSRVREPHRRTDRTSEDHEHTTACTWRLTCGNVGRSEWGRVTTGRWCRSAAGGGGEVEEAGWFGQVQGGEDRLVPGGEGGTLGDLAVAGGEGDQMHPVELLAGVAPGVAGGVLHDADQHEGEPAELDVGADAVFAVVEDRA